MSIGGTSSAGAALGLTPELLQALERLSLPSRRPVLGTSAGQRRSRRYGSSLDLADYRAYTPGDDIRRLDWSAYARLDRLFLRLYAAEEDACVTTWVDTSASMAWDPIGKEQAARGLAGALAYLALSADDRAACIGFAGGVVGRAGPVRGKRAAPRLWAALAALPRGGTTDWGGISAAARSVPRGVAVVLSDFLTEDLPKQALASLRMAGHEVVLVQVLSPLELLPVLRGELRLVDTETASSVELTLGQAALAAYDDARAAHTRSLQALAASHGARLVTVDGGVPLRQLVLGQLVGARVVR
ncbi:MAG TPA: DUF58 domain-containing protein [Acidimicrobiales bacterium]|nr:DUF58 domain-containing protein [Acidimicrobiales bacterium]